MSTPRFAVDRIHRIAVIGAGTMGHGIAHVAALAGHDVRLYDVTAEAAAAGRAKVVANLGKGVELGKLAGELRDAALARLTATGDLAAACAEVDLVIEATTRSPPACPHWWRWQFQPTSAANAASAPRPASARIRIGTPARVAPASTTANGPTANATRYDGSGGVAANRTTRVAPRASSLAIGAFDAATSAAGTSSVSVHGTFASGSSTHGKVRRAYSASCWVNAYHAPSTCWRNVPAVSTRSSDPR